MKNDDRASEEKEMDASDTKRYYPQVLRGKVVLLIGYDTAVVRDLLINLAQRGADIALICRQRLSRESVRDITQNVEALGRRMLLMEANTQSPAWLIQTVQINLGSLDMFIDLSAQSSTAAQKENAQSAERQQQNWDMTQAAMKAITAS